MKMKGCIDDGVRFFKVPCCIFDILKGEFEALFLFTYLRSTFNLLNNADKLQEDGSFFLPTNKIMSATGLTRRKFEKARNVLVDLKLISIEIKSIKRGPQSGRIQYFYFNVDYYNELVANGRGNELNDFIFDDVIEEEVQSVAKNATVDEKNLKPAKEKQVGNKKKSTEKKPKKEESNALTIVEMQAPIQAEQLDYKQRVINAWNFIASRYETTPKIQLLSEKRLKQFKNSLKFFNMDERTFFNRINETLRCSKYLRGLTKDWRADFDWFINPNNALKAFEGRYKDNPNRIMEILQDPASMSFREAQEAREKLKMEQWLHDEEEAEEQKALPQ